jgi:[protein-PII] uridylyltransferase
LFLAMLFHDVGKGHGEGHSERGASFVRGIASRLPVNEDDAEQWEFLVRQHLLMSYLAQHRDTHDPRLVSEFARTVGSVDNLKALYVMTFADIRAVGARVWNNWRDMLLAELYLQTLAFFEQGQWTEGDESAHAERVRRRLVATIDEAHRGAFERFLASMPARYLTTTPEQHIPAHFTLVNRLREAWSTHPAHEHRHLFVTSVRHVPEAEYSEFTICTPDRPGLFAMITGVLTSHGMNIAGARISTSRGGVALDSFRIAHVDQRERVLEAERWERVEQALTRVLRGAVDVAHLVSASHGPSILERRVYSRVGTEVVVDNTIADDYTVLDVITQDRVGVLFKITHTLHRLGVVIHLAKITTQVDQVFDVFYVTDADGAKITDEARLTAIRVELERQLAELGASAADSAGG